MAKRQIIPEKRTITVVGGTGFVDIAMVGTLAYIAISPAVASPGARAQVKLSDQDAGMDIFKDPKAAGTVPIEFYSYALVIPVNGNYRLTLAAATSDGAYDVYTVIEERANVR